MANSYLTKVLLEEELGYDNVELKLADDVGPVYEELIEGETDAFLDAWMPNHEQFVEGGRGRIEVLQGALVRRPDQIRHSRPRLHEGCA